MRALLLVLLLALPLPLSAQSQFDWKPSTAFAASRVFSTWATHRFLTNGSGCTEANVHLGPHPATRSVALMNAGAFVVVASSHYLTHRLTHGTRFGKWVNRFTGYGLAGYTMNMGVQDIRRCPNGR